MSRACICIGISEYKSPDLDPLPGTITDVGRMFAALTDPSIGECDPVVSLKIINPTDFEAKNAIGELVYNEEIEILNLYFACHGCVHDASYYFACNNTDLSRIALTALSLSVVFQLLTDGGVRHTNIIIDACEAGGMASDLPTLFKVQTQGMAVAMSLSILTLSARDENAGEDTTGGFGTTALLELMDGQIDTGSNKSHLSLDDVGQAIRIRCGDQTAKLWSFSISGTPKFCRNVFAEAHRTDSIFPVPNIVPVAATILDSTTLDRLLLAFKALDKELVCRELQAAIENAISQIGDGPSQANFLHGLFASCLSQAALNPDCFSKVLLTGVFLLPCQGVSPCNERDELEDFLWDSLDDEMGLSFVQIERDIRDERLYLLHADGGFVEFFTLPLRISRLAAWCLFFVSLSESSTDRLAARRVQCASILRSIEQIYSSSFDLISEEQASDLVVISALCKRLGFAEWAENYIGHLYNNYFRFKGKVASTELSPSLVYDFMEYRLFTESADYQKFSSKPSELVFALLLHFMNFSQMDVVRYDFSEFDGVHVNTFVPESYADFASGTVADGNNFGFTVGFDVFTVADFESFVTSFLVPSVDLAGRFCSDRELDLSVVASLLYPDRIALHLLDILIPRPS